MAAQHLNVPLPFWLRLVAARNETNTPRRAAKPHCAHFVIVLFQHVIVAGNQIFSSVTKQLCKYSARRRKKKHTHTQTQTSSAPAVYDMCMRHGGRHNTLAHSRASAADVYMCVWCVRLCPRAILFARKTNLLYNNIANNLKINSHPQTLRAVLK